jgi:hypothetical protein
MTILDKLMEKKDLLIYIDCRIKHLKRQCAEEMKHLKSSEREKIRQRSQGRISELHYLKMYVDDIKTQAKRYWSRCEEKKEEIIIVE